MIVETRTFAALHTVHARAPRIIGAFELEEMARYGDTFGGEAKSGTYPELLHTA